MTLPVLQFTGRVNKPVWRVVNFRGQAMIDKSTPPDSRSDKMIPEPTKNDFARDADLDFKTILEDPLGSAWAWIRLAEYHRKRAEAAESERDQLLERVKSLEEALRPFATFGNDPVLRLISDETDLAWNIKLGWCRRAAKLLETISIQLPPR